MSPRTARHTKSTMRRAVSQLPAVAPSAEELGMPCLAELRLRGRPNDVSASAPDVWSGTRSEPTQRARARAARAVRGADGAA
eukprot:2415419-Pleurochrysis_carterae.AAC.2